MTVTSKMVKMTPQKAQDILTRNNHNRPVSDSVVTKYSRDIKNGKWTFNGSPIIIGKNNQLIDGQHRLNAVVQSGVTLEMFVVEGVDPSAFKTIDIGKKRTGADALSTYDKELRKNAPVLSAAIVTISQFDQEGVYHSQRRSTPPSHGDIIDFIKKNKGILRSADFVSTLVGAKKFVPFSALVALHFLLGRIDINACESFFHKLNTGEGLQKGDPVLLLRNRLIEVRHSGGGIFRTREILPYILKTWEYIREGRSVERLRVDNDYIPRII